MKKWLTSVLHMETTNRDLILLIVIGGLYALGIFLSNTFVNVYLWRQTNDYLTIATYNLAIFILQPLTFIAAGKLAKKIDRVIVLRLGVTFLALFFLTVLFLGEHAAHFNIILGCLLGIGYGFYWLAFNVLTFEITEPETRDYFNGFVGALESFGGMVAPVVAGAIIAKLATNIGYMTVFAISLSLFLLAIICSMFLQRRNAEGKYHFKEVFKELNENKDWKNIVFANFFLGIREGIFIFVITIWVFVITQSEFALGIFHLTLNGVSLLSYFLVVKVLRPSKRKIALFIGSVIISFSIFILVFQLSYPILILYAFTIGLAYPILDVPYNSVTYDVIGVSNYAKEWRIEYVVVFEMFVNLGRVLSIAIFIVMFLLFGEPAIRYLLIIMSQSYLFLYYFMRKVHITN